jgi:hypothetical protein
LASFTAPFGHAELHLGLQQIGTPALPRFQQFTGDLNAILRRLLKFLSGYHSELSAEDFIKPYPHIIHHPHFLGVRLPRAEVDFLTRLLLRNSELMRGHEFLTEEHS